MGSCSPSTRTSFMCFMCGCWATPSPRSKRRSCRGLPTRRELSRPSGLPLNSAGDLYLVDGQRVRVATADGRIATVAGAGAHGYSGDGGSAVLAELALTPGYVGQGVATAVVVDVDGTLYIADQESQRVRRV